MRSHTSTCVVAALFVVWTLALLDAQPAGPLTPRGAVLGSAAARATAVFGYVWDANNHPIAEARVRLRNVTTGRIVAHAVTNANGEFTFEDLEGGSYMVEYVDSRDRVIAVGHVFSAAPRETVVTFIRLATRSSWLAVLFGSTGSTAATVVASAASLGVTALAPAPRDVTADH